MLKVSVPAHDFKYKSSIWWIEIWMCRLLFRPDRPANGGRTCVGATYQFQMCNSNECEDIYSDTREEQCHAWDPRFELHSNKHRWLPYEHPDREYAHAVREGGFILLREGHTVCWRKGLKHENAVGWNQKWRIKHIIIECGCDSEGYI